MGVQCTVIREATHAYLIVTVPTTQLVGIVMDLEAADGVTVPSICFRLGWDGWGRGARVMTEHECHTDTRPNTS